MGLGSERRVKCGKEDMGSVLFIDFSMKINISRDL